MINKTNLLMGIAVMFIVTVSSAQVPAVSSNSSVSTEIEGTPYLDETFVQGYVYYDNTSTKVPLRYNIFRDIIEFQQSGVTMALEPSAKIKKVIFGSNTFVAEKFEYKNKTKYGYLTLLDSGKVMLYAKKVVTFFNARKGGAIDGRDLPASYTRMNDVYYYKVGDGPIQEVENIKSMIASLPDKQEELTVYAKKEKVSPRKEQKMIMFVQHYNSL